jgi:hypothetical protein
MNDYDEKIRADENVDCPIRQVKADPSMEKVIRSSYVLDKKFRNVDLFHPSYRAML